MDLEPLSNSTVELGKQLLSRFQGVHALRLALRFPRQTDKQCATVYLDTNLGEGYLGITLQEFETSEAPDSHQSDTPSIGLVLNLDGETTQAIYFGANTSSFCLDDVEIEAVLRDLVSGLDYHGTGQPDPVMNPSWIAIARSPDEYVGELERPNNLQAIRATSQEIMKRLAELYKRVRPVQSLSVGTGSSPW